LVMEFDGTSTSRDGDAVDYVALPRVSNSQVKERTFCAWIYLTVDSGAFKGIISPFADSGGVQLAISGVGIDFYSNLHNVTPGQWQSLTTNISLNTWTLLCASYNHTSTSNVPALYINATAQTLNTVQTPAGTLNSELGTHVVIGNAKTATEDYTYPFAGKIYDPRIYNRIITAAEVTTLYNGGTPDSSLVTDGLVLQGFCVRTDKLTDYTDVELDRDSRVLENAYKAVGFVHGSPIARAAP
jgi:hypothetical protein